MDNNLILEPGDITPSRVDALHNRTKILETAVQLFKTYGTDEVSMTQIAKEAQVGKGTLYRHFANKIELCQALLDEAQRDLQQRTFALMKQDLSPCDKLRWFLTETATYVYENVTLLATHIGAFGASQLSHPAHWWWRNTISALLEQNGLQERRSYITDVLYVMLDAMTIHFQRNHMGYSLEEITDGLLAVFELLTASTD
jgi:AcrR family transcriptional regulator